MPNGEGRALLWVDDDGPDRFLYEEYILTQKGWRVVWATSVSDALTRINEDTFEAIVLDQMLPIESGPVAPTDVWSGCLLLYWLRGKPRPLEAPQAEDTDVFVTAKPSLHNRLVTVVIVSAFHDDEVEAAIKAVEPPPQTVRKPIDFDELIGKLTLGDADA